MTAQRLPRSVDELRGLRAARWIRESTAGQFDRFGPEAQRTQQDRAIERHGLIDTGLVWEVQHSGRTIAATGQWSAMLAGAGVSYDVLVVGYVSRFARDLETAVSARRSLHGAGAAILFADERILTSDEDAWERWAREAVEAEAYSRRLGKRIAEGYAAKRSSMADPGGHPPFGFHRDPTTKLLEADPDRRPTVARIYDLAAQRLTDREVAAATGIGLYVVRGMLTSPLYVGRLRSGERAHWAPLVDVKLWEEVQAIRARRRTRDGRPSRRRPYALTMLHCASCGRHLIGDTGRYRHPDPCAAFTAVRREPRRRGRGQRRGMPGHSYAASEYEGIVRELLARVSLGADLVADVVAETRAPEPDRLALARIGRERDSAVARYRRDRDTAALEATMVRLDEQEATANDAHIVSSLSPAEVVEYLRDLPRLWDEAPASRRGLAESLFDRIEVLGLRRMRVSPTTGGLAAGLPAAFANSSAGYGRGERTRALVSQQIHGCRVTIAGARPDPLPVLRTA